MDDLLSEFLTETNESLATLDVELVNLEKNPNDRALLSNIFRLVHTIKGTCGFLGLPRLEKIAHAGENVMSKFRDGELEVTPPAVTLIFEAIDQIKEILSYIEENEVEPEGSDADIISRLNLAAEGQLAESSSSDDIVEEEVEAVVEAPVEEKKAAPAPAAPQNSFPVAAELLAEVEEALAQGKKAASFEDINKEMEKERQKEKASRGVPAKAETKEPQEVKDSDSSSSIANQSIRVNVDLLENLMTLVSELVLTRNQLLQMVRGRDDSEFSSPLQRLSHITTDLQEGVMKTRMQPIGNAWAKLPRIVRDLCNETGKKIELQMLGAETELDRQVLEMIRDPLTHMVRNSADHGLESREERVAVGKPEIGTIKLNAFHEGGHIIIEISDDGQGLSIERIREKAVSNGLVSESEAELLSDQQIAQYIFKAGFSTAQKVTSVSGRGVGMDVVKTNIDKIGGNIELKTVQGKGTTFTIKIPLTLAIVSALIVESATQRFAIPQISVLELVRVTEKSEQTIEVLNNAPVLRLRDRLLPLVNLSKLLKLDNQVNDEDKNETFIVILQVGTYTFGIIVDRVFDTEEIVVKPVAPILRHITLFSGNTILGDGSVIMILDPNGVASAIGETVEGADADREDDVAAIGGDDKTSLLVFRSGSHDLKAVPLALVARLEEIESSSIEYTYGRPVVQYRGHLMPLVTIDDNMSLKGEGRQAVLVFSEGERSMGLAVDEIVDIVEDKLTVELDADIEGIIGTAVINGKATDVIDAGSYLVKAFGDWFGDETGKANLKKARKTVLMLDDSAFFRNLTVPMLSAHGYDVVAVSNPKEALELREDGMRFDAIVTDIEMPDMDGFAFAKEVKSQNSSWLSTPLVALSSHSTEADFDKGRQVGFDDYVTKYDRDALVTVLNSLLGSMVS